MKTTGSRKATEPSSGHHDLFNFTQARLLLKKNRTCNDSHLDGKIASAIVAGQSRRKNTENMFRILGLDPLNLHLFSQYCLVFS